MNVNHFDQTKVEAAKALSDSVNKMPAHPSQYDQTKEKNKKTRYDSKVLYGSLT